MSLKFISRFMSVDHFNQGDGFNIDLVVLCKHSNRWFPRGVACSLVAVIPLVSPVCLIPRDGRQHARRMKNQFSK